MRIYGLFAALTLFVCGGAAPEVTAEKKNENESWEGRIDLGGGAGLRLVLHLTTAKDGTLSATADSPDQGAAGLKVDTIARDKTSLTFTMKRLAAEFSGKFNAEGTEAVGEFTQRGKGFPLTLKVLPPSTTEFWEGKLALGGGIQLRLVLKVSKSQKDGALRATFASPDQGPGDLSVDTIQRDKDILAFSVKRIGGEYSGKLNAEGTEAVGEWKQNGSAFPLTLGKTEKASGEARRPQMPKPPFPYQEEKVGYENKGGHVYLTGTLTLPEGTGPFPAVVLISGSGAQDRDESLLGHKPFWVLADHLTRRGIAVLRVDDRGVGGSTGSTVTSTSDDFAGDVLTGVTFLKAHSQIDSKRIGLIGHSEGGIIAPIVAARSKDIAFIVLMAGTGLPGDEILRLQAGLIAKAGGAKEDKVARDLVLQKRLIDVVKSEKDEKAAKDKMDAIVDEYTKGLSETERAEVEKIKKLTENGLNTLRSPWFRYFLTFDPRHTLAKVNCPVLAINGEKDLQVPPKENLAEIEKAVKSSGNLKVTVKELPGLNHLFQTCKTGAPSEYAGIEETISPDALEVIGDWVRDQTGVSTR